MSEPDARALLTVCLVIGCGEPRPTVAPVQPPPQPTAANAVSAAPARTAAPTSAPQLERPDRRAPRQVRIAGGPYVLDTFFDPARGRPVTVAPFWLDVTEVTASQFAQCVAAGACDSKTWVTPDFELQADSQIQMGFRQGACTLGAPGNERHPINCIGWRQAHAFCAWAGGRLPTIAEWEFAAAGSAARRYPWGSEPFDATRGNLADLALQRVQKSKQVGLHYTDSSFDDGFAFTAPVGSYPPGASPDGVFDLIGNVHEWLEDEDCAELRLAAAGGLGTREPPCKGPQRAIRGTSWVSAIVGTASAPNSNDEKDYATERLGFRCAASTSAN